MASASDLPAALIDELLRAIADRGIEAPPSGDPADRFVAPARIPDSLAGLAGLALPRAPEAVAVDVYGTLMASAMGEIGPGSAWEDESFKEIFPHDMAERLHGIVTAMHDSERARGIPWPEVDAPVVFALALGLGPEDGARACVAWECANNRCAAMPGAAAFLEACAARGLPLGIVSNAQFYTPLFLEAAFGSTLAGLGFDPGLALWSYETRRAKPDRWMFDELARRLSSRGVPADRVLYVGNDALNDCAAAGEAGMMTALFCGDARSCKPRVGEARVAARPPDTLAQSWDDLRRLVCT